MIVMSKYMGLIHSITDKIYIFAYLLFSYFLWRISVLVDWHVNDKAFFDTKVHADARERHCMENRVATRLGYII